MIKLGSMRRKMKERGHVTIPKRFRDRLGLKPGDEVEFRIRGDSLTRSPAFDPEIDPEGPLDDEIE